ITAPSASGSENGTPTSSTSAPAASSPCMSATLRRTSGCPAVTYGTKARRPVALSVAKRRAIASDEIVANPDAITLWILSLDDGAKEQPVGPLLRQIGDEARMHQVVLRVADDAHVRARQHLGDGVHRVH